MKQHIFHGALAFLVTALAGCSDTAGVNDIDGPVRVDFRFQRADGAGMHVAAPWTAHRAGTARPVTPEQVAALTITVDSIRVLAVAADDSSDAAWTTVVLDAPATLDLMALPTDDASPVTVMSGTVPAGDYRKVRLFVSGAEITFTEDIVIGNAHTYEAGVTHPVTVPSGRQNGLKTDLAFTAEEGADVPLVFDEGTTFQNVSVTGNGRVNLAPVIRAPRS